MGMMDKMKNTVTEMGSNLGIGGLASGVIDFATNILKGGNLSSFKFEEVEKHFSSVIGQVPSGSLNTVIEKALINLSEPERTSLSSLVDTSAREQNLVSYGEENRVNEEDVHPEIETPMSAKPDQLATRLTRIQQNSPQFLSTLASSFVKSKPDAQDTSRVQDMAILQKFLGGIVTAYATSDTTGQQTVNRSNDTTDKDLRRGA